MARRKKIKVFFAVMLWVCACLIIVLYNSLNTANAIDLVTPFILSAIVPLTGIIPLDYGDTLALCPVMLIEITLFKTIRYDTSLELLVFMLDVCIFLAVKTKKPFSCGIGVLLNVIIGALSLMTYYPVIHLLIPLYYDSALKYSWSAPVKAVVIIFAGAVFTFVFISVLFMLGRIFGRWREVFDTVSEKFHDLEVYVLILTAFTLVCFFLLGYIIPHDDSSMLYSHYIAPVRTVLEVLVFLIEGVFVCLLLKTVSIKEKMKTAENYRDSLEENLENLSEVRHDVKNLLLTMSGYVMRSDDSEMKDFYRENIVPILSDTVYKSELQNKLKILQSDEVKSFLYFKLTEISAKGIMVDFTAASPLAISVGIGDLCRIFGILIDNAAEEAVLAGGGVGLKISEDDSTVTLRVSNRVRDEIRRRGVTAGTTDKGLGRGKGLLIAEKIIKKYSNVVLSSYFTDDEFVQCLIISK